MTKKSNTFKPNKLIESVQNLNIHSEYANTPTAKHSKGKDHRESKRPLKSPQAMRPTINSSKYKNEKAFYSFKASSDAKEHLDSFLEE